jgi:hypothetical protein
MIFENKQKQCPTVGQLYAFASRELMDYPEDTAKEVVWHVYTCRTCQEYVKDLQDTLPSLQPK